MAYLRNNKSLSLGFRLINPISKSQFSTKPAEIVESNAKTMLSFPSKSTMSKWKHFIPSTNGVNSILPKSAQNLVERVRKPGNLRKALSLQLNAAWQRHQMKFIAGGVLVTTYMMWRSMRFTAGAFVDISTTLAKTGLFALAASVSVAGITIFYRRHFIINPSAVYRAAMLRLNTHPGVLDILGAPITGSDVRATVLTGGGLKFKGVVPKIRSRRVQMIFPLRGAERKGLVSIEAKKRNGQLKTTMLAVDVPMPTALGGEQRVYIEGGPQKYSKSSVLDELRKPFLAALASEEAVDAEDEAEDAAVERKERMDHLMEQS